MPLTLFSTLGKAYRFLWAERRDLFAYAFLPVVLIAFVQFAGLWATGDWLLYFKRPAPGAPDAAETGTQVVIGLGNLAPVDVAATAANGIASFAGYVMFAVAWIRRYLVGPEGTTIGAALRWGPRHWHFVGRFFTIVGLVLLLALVLTVPVDLLSATNPLLGLFARAAVVVGSLLITARMLLVLPAAAMDRRLGFRNAGIATRGRSWYMLGIYIFSLFPALFALLIVARLVGGLADALAGPSLAFLLVTLVIQQAIMFVAIAAQVTGLAEAFRELAGTAPPAAPAANPSV